jgi:16S rRNA (guanine1516-N2)-methyltransferase
MISILPHTPEDRPFAQALSLQLGLPLFVSAELSPVVLVVSEQNAWLRRLIPPVIDWRIDFDSPEYLQNFAGRTRHNDPLSRAIGLHKKPGLRVLDMTAGLGKDALWLSQCGAQVTMIERHPALAYLLSQAVEKFDSTMQVICEEAETYLSTVQSDQFDVAYYDPMFEPRSKTALVKKDMQILQALHGHESPDAALILIAKNHIPKIVVKRGKADPVLCEGVHHQLSTKVTRYDIY